MRRADLRRMGVNRRKWDESVPLHIASASYDVPAFRRGTSTLSSIEVHDIGPVRGRSLLHLQCHFGLDTLSWRRLGARVVGVDFSRAAVEAARQLASDTRLKAEFIESNVYDLSRKLDRRFDIVYTAKGAIGWLPDIEAWARVVARFLKPGGRFYMLEDHPFSDIYLNESWATKFEFRYPYFAKRPQRDDTDGTYATEARMKNRVSYGWMHTASSVLNALRDAGLTLGAVREFPYTYWKKFPFMRRDRSGWWHLTRDAGAIPLMWSVEARNGAGSERGG